MKLKLSYFLTSHLYVKNTYIQNTKVKMDFKDKRNAWIEIVDQLECSIKIKPSKNILFAICGYNKRHD